MNLESLFHNILTSGIKSSDPETVRRIKNLNIFQFAFIMMAPLLGLFYFFIGATPLFYIATIAGLLMMPGILLLRKSHNLALSANYAIFILWAMLLFISWFTGAITYEGVIKPTWVLNGGLILLAIFFNGYLGGTLWSAIVFMETGAVIYLFRTGYQFPNLIPSEIAAIYSLGTYMLGLLAILTFAFLFETEKNVALAHERKKTQSLRDSKRYMDELVEKSPIATFALDTNHRVVQWNRACLNMTGVKAEEILGKRIWTGFTVDDLGSLADILLERPGYIQEKFGDSILSHTETGWYEVDMILPGVKEGLRAIVTVGPILDKNDVVRGAIQTIQQIEDRRDEEQHEGSLDRIHEAFSGDPIFKIDSQGRVSHWNKACEERFGYKAEQVISKNVLMLVAKQYQNLFKQEIIQAFNDKPFNGQEWKYITSTGKAVYVMARAFVEMSADAQVKECVVINTDVTNLRLRQKALKLYASEAKEKLKTLSEEHELLKKNIASFIRKKEK